MFDIGSLEFLLVALLLLLVAGPRRLPHLVRHMGLWTRQARQAINAFKWQLEHTLADEDLRRMREDADKPPEHPPADPR